MSEGSTREDEVMLRATQRVVKAQANRLLRKMQVAVRDKAKVRQINRKRLLAFGAAVIKAGCDQWAPEEVGGALMDVRERIGDSVTMRLGFRKRAEATSPRKRGSVRSTPAPVTADATDAQQPQPPERIAAHAAEP